MQFQATLGAGNADFFTRRKIIRVLLQPCLLKFLYSLLALEFSFFFFFADMELPCFFFSRLLPY